MQSHKNFLKCYSELFQIRKEVKAFSKPEIFREASRPPKKSIEKEVRKNVESD
jgi:hypothetical protein